MGAGILGQHLGPKALRGHLPLGICLCKSASPKSSVSEALVKPIITPSLDDRKLTADLNYLKTFQFWKLTFPKPLDNYTGNMNKVVTGPNKVVIKMLHYK